MNGCVCLLDKCHVTRCIFTAADCISRAKEPLREQMQTQIRKFEGARTGRRRSSQAETHLDSSVLLNMFFCFFLCVFFSPSLLLGWTESVAAHYCKSSAAGGECTTDGRRCVHGASGGVFMNSVWSGRCARWLDELKKRKGQWQRSVTCCGYSSRQLERFDEGFCTMQSDFADVVWSPRGCLPQQTVYWFTPLHGVFAVS